MSGTGTATVIELMGQAIEQLQQRIAQQQATIDHLAAENAALRLRLEPPDDAVPALVRV